MPTEPLTISEPMSHGAMSGITLYLPTAGESCTDEEFFRLHQANPEWRFERNADGSVKIMTPPGSETGGTNHRIAVKLGVWCETDGSGLAFDSSTFFKLPNGSIRSPDASWILLKRWKTLPRAERRKIAPIVPDFVIELKSPSDTIASLRKKMREYIDVGVRLGWLIDPDEKAVEIYRPGVEVVRIENATSVVGDPELPGFVMNIAAVWMEE